jgi:adenine phosphoribosyltransferase|tara:strand:- start:2758 stop:3270 length:513 start_codon:yes stop_codon:yes gene_type:complete
MDLKPLIRDIPDFPEPGIMFRDITTLLQNHQALTYVIDYFANSLAEQSIDYIIAIEARGFILGAPLAYHLGAGFIPVRKPGKLPAKVHSVDYQLEYGTDRLEIHQDAIKQGSNVLVVDDVIATGGTAAATAELLEKFSCNLLGFAFIVELTGLEGRNKLPNVPIHSIIQY